MPNQTPNETPAPRKWTFMVYMAAGDSHKLDTVAVRDLKEMEIGTKNNDEVAVVVQINRHWPNVAQRYEISSSGTRQLRSPTGKTNMGDPKTLRRFVTEVVSTKRYLAEHYCLVLWGHAFGLGFGRDEQDPLHISELRGVLEQLKKERSGKSLDLLGTNACAMSYLEAAFELRNVASFMVASQITVPFAGWPYGVILSQVNRKAAPIDLAKVIVDAFVTQFDDLPGGDRLAMSMLNLRHAQTCGERVRTLASAIDEQLSSGFDTDMRAALRDVFMGAAAGDVRPLIDLTTLCETLGGDGPDEMPPSIVDAAKKLLAALQPPNSTLESADLTPEVNTKTLVAYHRAHPALIDLKGIGIYAPFITDQDTLNRLELAEPSPDGERSLESGLEIYQDLELFKATKGRDKDNAGIWPRLVYKDLQRTIPAELMVEIDGIGELQSGDRADVAQIIMSIEAVLNGLDRAVARARRDLLSVIAKKPKRATYGVDTSARPRKAFGLPWLRLVSPLTAQELREADDLRHQRARVGAGSYRTSGSSDQRLDVVDYSVDRLARVEVAIGVAERTIRRGLTHARFGLGPFSLTKPGTGLTKPGTGLTKPGTGLTKPGTGLTKPGTGDGATSDTSALLRPGLSSGDLRADLALLRVADLFTQVGESMIALEEAATDLEAAARATLVVSPISTPQSQDTQRATAQELDQRFAILSEASSDARRTLRRVLAHPVYGLGPGEDSLSLDAREELAVLGGLGRRHLKLL